MQKKTAFHWKSKRLIITIRTLLLAANQSCCKAIWHNLTRREPTRWGNQDLDMWVQKKVTVENRDICCERTTFWRELTVKTVKTKIDIFVTMSAMGSQASDREKPWFWRERTTFWRERTVKTVKTQIDMFVTISALSWLESDSLQVHLIIARFWFTKRWFLIFGGAMALPNLPFPVAEFGWDKLDHSSSSWPGWKTIWKTPWDIYECFLDWNYKFYSFSFGALFDIPADGFWWPYWFDIPADGYLWSLCIYIHKYVLYIYILKKNQTGSL